LFEFFYRGKTKKLLSLILLFTLTACTLGERRPKQTGSASGDVLTAAPSAAVNVPVSTPTNAATTTGGGTRKNKSSATNVPVQSTSAARRPVGIYPLGQSNSLRAQYLEVFALNVNAFPNVIQQAHNELFAQP
jgi:hypothetical protein